MTKLLEVIGEYSKFSVICFFCVFLQLNMDFCGHLSVCVYVSIVCSMDLCEVSH